MTPRFVRYRRRPETCTGCRQPIEREPTTDGSLYGWRPTSGTCYPCWLITLFGCNMMPTEIWWRKVRRLVRAGHALSLFNDAMGLDEDILF